VLARSYQKVLMGHHFSSKERRMAHYRWEHSCGSPAAATAVTLNSISSDTGQQQQHHHHQQ
jgi:hypothetical protein